MMKNKDIFEGKLGDLTYKYLMKEEPPDLFLPFGPYFDMDLECLATQQATRGELQNYLENLLEWDELWGVTREKIEKFLEYYYYSIDNEAR